MVVDHALEEEPIKFRSTGGSERGHLLRSRHARHAFVAGVIPCPMASGRHRVTRVRGGRARRCLATVAQPPAHERDLVGLGGGDPPGRIHNLAAIGPPADQRSHLHRLLVVQDHVLHEPHIIRGEACVGDADGFGRAQHARRLAWRSWLQDRHLLREAAAAGVTRKLITAQPASKENDERRWMSKGQDPLLI
jgi:hypothetical protein